MHEKNLTVQLFFSFGNNLNFSAFFLPTKIYSDIFSFVVYISYRLNGQNLQAEFIYAKINRFHF